MRGDQLNTIKGLAQALLEEVESAEEDQGLLAEPGGEGWAGFYEMVREFEIRLIRRALLRTHGHQGRAARLLRLNESTLSYKIKLYNLGADGRMSSSAGVATTKHCSGSCARSKPAP